MTYVERCLSTTRLPAGETAVNGSHARTIRSWYDPQAEFLEIAVEANGKH